LSPIARKRLAALKEFSELGSGFKIAALDLELRGAGNLLGGEQSGQIATVGFETYCRMLEDEIRRLRGEEVEETVRASLRLQLDVHIPTDYIVEESQRLRAYKRIAEAPTDEDREQIAAELADRYGPLPQAVRNLVEYSAIKSQAEQMRIAAVERQARHLRVRFREDSKVDPQRLMDFVAKTPGAKFSPSGELEWPAADGDAPRVLGAVKGLLDRLRVA
jgi:transcription-repair coupling factor (superfamily II helicase)